jgi:hypothetical protein
LEANPRPEKGCSNTCQPFSCRIFFIRHKWATPAAMHGAAPVKTLQTSALPRNAHTVQISQVITSTFSPHHFIPVEMFRKLVTP